jgi:hypothetical protein
MKGTQTSVSLWGISKVARHHPDDLTLRAVDLDPATQDLGMGAHSPSPEPLADQSHRRRALGLVRGREETANASRHAEDLEERRAHPP